MENNTPRYGFVEEPYIPEGGKVARKYKISFKVEQLEALKQFATAKGNVYVEVVDLREGKPFLSVWDPASAPQKGSGKTYAPRQAQPQAANDLPF
jgi:hypothetical protein